MSRRRSDESFVAFAGGQRGRLIGAAVLSGGTSEQAHELVAWALATTYPRWSRAERPDLDVARLVLQSDVGVVEAPWREQPRTRIALVDATAPTLAAIPAALQRLPRQQRVVLVGRHHLGLSDRDLATVTGLEPAQVAQLARDAGRAFGPDDVAARLASALVTGSGATRPGPAADDEHTAQDDLAHGRWVQRRRRVRTLLVAAVVALLVGILVVQFRPSPTPVSAPVVDPAPTATPSATPTPRCDTREQRCQVQATRAWRAEIATLVATALDPDGRYFTGGFSYGYDDRYDGYWSSRDGALGLNLLSADGGATQVFVQVATSRASAVPCGTITDHRCVRQQFLDGNWFTLSPSVDVAHGMEIQYRPDGDEVITLVAYDTTKGRSLEIGRGDLLDLIQDPRLRLPPR